MVYDIMILGGGPAGLSAALTARMRGKETAIVSGAAADIPLYRSARIDNYPGLPHVSGKVLLETFRTQAEEAQVQFLPGRALAAASLGETFGVSVGSEFYEARSLILATGTALGRPYPGEKEFLGRGVSYCATCDGMLYQDKAVAVIGLCAEAPEEADFLRNIGCKVAYFDKKQPYSIQGSDKVEALVTPDETVAVDAVFILRSGIAAADLLPGLEMENGHIRVDAAMATSLPGVFACGDCTGAPYQITKATGEGTVAALSAAAWCAGKTK